MAIDISLPGKDRCMTKVELGCIEDTLAVIQRVFSKGSRGLDDAAMDRICARIIRLEELLKRTRCKRSSKPNLINMSCSSPEKVESDPLPSVISHNLRAKKTARFQEPCDSESEVPEKASLPEGNENLLPFYHRLWPIPGHHFPKEKVAGPKEAAHLCRELKRELKKQTKNRYGGPSKWLCSEIDINNQKRLLSAQFAAKTSQRLLRSQYHEQEFCGIRFRVV